MKMKNKTCTGLPGPSLIRTELSLVHLVPLDYGRPIKKES